MTVARVLCCRCGQIRTAEERYISSPCPSLVLTLIQLSGKPKGYRMLFQLPVVTKCQLLQQLCQRYSNQSRPCAPMLTTGSHRSLPTCSSLWDPVNPALVHAPCHQGSVQQTSCAEELSPVFSDQATAHGKLSNVTML